MNIEWLVSATNRSYIKPPAAGFPNILPPGNLDYYWFQKVNWVGLGIGDFVISLFTTKTKNICKKQKHCG